MSQITLAGASPPFTSVSVKATGDTTERFQSITGNTVYFAGIIDSTSHSYTVTVVKDGCETSKTFTLECQITRNGSFDEATCDVIRGWVADTTNKATISVDIYIDDNLVASNYPANTIRSDVAAAIGSSSNTAFGFEFPVPAQYKTAGTHTVKVYYNGTSDQIPGSSKTYVCTATNTVSLQCLNNNTVRVSGTFTPTGNLYIELRDGGPTGAVVTSKDGVPNTSGSYSWDFDVSTYGQKTYYAYVRLNDQTTLTSSTGTSCGVSQSPCTAISAANITISNSSPANTAGSTITLTASGGAAGAIYQWNDGFTGPSKTITLGVAGSTVTHTVTVTNPGSGSNCSASKSLTITAQGTTSSNCTALQNPLNVSSSNNNPSQGSTITLSVSGSGINQNTTYVWSGPAGFSSASASPTVTLPSTTGTFTYSVIATNSDGTGTCTASGSITFTFNPSASNSITANISCNSVNISEGQIVGAGSVSAWLQKSDGTTIGQLYDNRSGSSLTGTFTSFTDGSTINLTSGTYYVFARQTGNDSNTVTSSQVTVTCGTPPPSCTPPQANISVAQNGNATNGYDRYTFTVNAYGGDPASYAYSNWTHPNGVLISGGGTSNTAVIEFPVPSSGSADYTVSVTVSNGCNPNATPTRTVSIANTPTSYANVNCNNNNLAISGYLAGATAITILLYKPDGSNIQIADNNSSIVSNGTFNTSFSLNGYAAGSYYVVVRQGDNNVVTSNVVTCGSGSGGGCTAPANLSVSANPASLSSAGNAVLTVTGSNITAGSSFTWRVSGNSTVIGTTQTITVNVSQSTTYEVTVSNGAGCSASESILVLVGSNCVPVSGAVINSNSSTYTVGTTYTFTANASGTDISYSNWDLNGGNYQGGGGSSNQIQAKFDSPGTYTIKVNVTGSCGNAQPSIQITVTSTECVPSAESNTGNTRCINISGACVSQVEKTNGCSTYWVNEGNNCACPAGQTRNSSCNCESTGGGCTAPAPNTNASLDASVNNASVSSATRNTEVAFAFNNVGATNGDSGSYSWSIQKDGSATTAYSGTFTNSWNAFISFTECGSYTINSTYTNCAGTVTKSKTVTVTGCTTECSNKPFYVVYVTQPTCNGSTLNAGSVFINNISNGDKFAVVESSTFNADHCTMSNAATLSGSSYTPSVTSPGQGQSKTYTIRIWKSSDCSCFTDYSFTLTAPTCSTECIKPSFNASFNCSNNSLVISNAANATSYAYSSGTWFNDNSVIGQGSLSGTGTIIFPPVILGYYTFRVYNSSNGGCYTDYPVNAACGSNFYPAAATFNLNFKNIDGCTQTDECDGTLNRSIDYDMKVVVAGGPLAGTTLYSSDTVGDERFMGGSNGDDSIMAVSYSSMRSPNCFEAFRRCMVSIPRARAAGYTSNLSLNVYVTRRTTNPGDVLYINCGSFGGNAGDMIATSCSNGADFYVQNITTSGSASKSLNVNSFNKDAEVFAGTVNINTAATSGAGIISIS